MGHGVGSHSSILAAPPTATLRRRGLDLRSCSCRGLQAGLRPLGNRANVLWRWVTALGGPVARSPYPFPPSLPSLLPFLPSLPLSLSSSLLSLLLPLSLRRRRFAAGENSLALGRACTTLGAAGRALGGVGSIWRAPGGLRRALGGRQGRSRGVGWRWVVLPGVGSAGGDEVGRGGLFDLPPRSRRVGCGRIRAGGKVFGSRQRA